MLPILINFVSYTSYFTYSNIFEALLLAYWCIFIVKSIVKVYFLRHQCVQQWSMWEWRHVHRWSRWIYLWLWTWLYWNWMSNRWSNFITNNIKILICRKTFLDKRNLLLQLHNVISKQENKLEHVFILMLLWLIIYLCFSYNNFYIVQNSRNIYISLLM